MFTNLKAIFKKYTKWQYIYLILFILYCLYDIYFHQSAITILWFVIMAATIVHALTKNRYLEIFSRFLLYLFIIINIVWFIQGLSFYNWAYSSQPDTSIYNNHLFLFLVRNDLFFLVLILAAVINRPNNRLRIKDIIAALKKKLRSKNVKTK